jgi:hypothetical protein
MMLELAMPMSLMHSVISFMEYLVELSEILFDPESLSLLLQHAEDR